MSTLSRLPIDLSYMKKSHMVVRAFDGTKREVMGNIELPIQVGPCTFNLEFIVMDINPSYNYLLGRPWIQIADAIPSTLYQKVKFVTGESLIIVAAEEDMVAMTTITTPYVEVKEDGTKCSFRSFEVTTTTYVKDGSEVPTPRLSKNTWMGIGQTMGKETKVGFSLGRNFQGKKRAILVAPKQDRYRLGYKPNSDEKKMINGKVKIE